jgi:hypothetical protein
MELTQLAGVFCFVECIELLGDYTLLCIDEFELDDPGNTTRSLAGGDSRRRTSCAKSACWQQFSTLSGSMDRTIGIATWLPPRRHRPTRTSPPEPPPWRVRQMLAGGFRKKYCVPRRDCSH